MQSGTVSEVFCDDQGAWNQGVSPQEARAIGLGLLIVYAVARSTGHVTSALLRAGPPAHPRSVLNPLRVHPRLGHSLSPPPTIRDASTRACLPTFPARAADQTHDAYMPDTARPVNGHPPGSSQGTPDSPWF